MYKLSTVFIALTGMHLTYWTLGLDVRALSITCTNAVRNFVASYSVKWLNCPEVSSTAKWYPYDSAQCY